MPAFRPSLPRRLAGRAAYQASHALLSRAVAHAGFHGPASRPASAAGVLLRALRARGEPAFVLGIGAGGHDAGTALVQVDEDGALQLVSSHVEERFVRRKHYGGFPFRSLAEVKCDLARLGLAPDALVACVASFDYVQAFSRGLEDCVLALPHSVALAHPDVHGDDLGHFWRALRHAPGWLATSLGRRAALPILAAPHHDCHAASAWALSPLARSRARTLVSVIDATGDDGAISLYLAENGRLRRLAGNRSLWDSLGHLYAFLASGYGGWPLGTGEGKWMAAAAWGRSDAAAREVYAGVRRLLELGPGGAVHIDRSRASWPVAGARRPFTRSTEAVLGPSARIGCRGSGSASLDFSGDEPEAELPARVDHAAATQRVFQEALLHVLSHWVAQTGAQQLVLSGGTALNCAANLQVFEHFDACFYARLGLPARRVSLWIPPAPADDGAPAGAACRFALANGAVPAPASDVFRCGPLPTRHALAAALASEPGLRVRRLGNAGQAGSRAIIARSVALQLARGSIVGLFRGRAEIGRRALGHRSLLAAAHRPELRVRLNAVKRREGFRPLAPVCTAREGPRWFELHPLELDGAPRYESYRFMGIAARVHPATRRRLPAAFHRDGTARVQIVDERDALLHEILVALGVHTGAEVALNTSLNVQEPIVQTPAQALALLRRDPGPDAIVLVSDDGDAFLASSARPSGRHGAGLPSADRGSRSA